MPIQWWNLDEDISWTNIFEEFSSKEELSKEVEKIQKKASVYDKLKIVNIGVFTLNILLWVLLIFSVVYLYIQNGSSQKSNILTDNFCSLFIGKDNTEYISSCFSVSSLIAKKQQELTNLKSSQYALVREYIFNLAAIENFLSKKSVVFLLDKSNSRLQPTPILEEFDALKLEFSSSDKVDLQCSNLSIVSGGNLSVSCDLYSSDWDSQVYTFDEGFKGVIYGGGTSVSRAASFIDFLENHPDSHFSVVSRTNTFSSTPVDLPPYTQKTTVDLELQYIDFNSIY